MKESNTVDIAYFSKAKNINDYLLFDWWVPYHIWELPGNYLVFTVVIVIYHYVEIILRILVTPIFLYNIYDH